MTISQRTATGLTASTDTSSPYDNVTYTLPTGHSANDFLIAFYAAKGPTATAGTPTDYTARSAGANGSTAYGVDNGSVYSVAFTKVHDGSESNPTSTVAAPTSPAMVSMQALYSSVSGTAWSIATTYGDDADTSGTSFSAVGSASLDFAVGDMLVVCFASNNDRSALSSGTASASGITFGTFTQQLSTTTTATGTDGQMSIWTATVSAGSGTQTPTFTGTLTSSYSSGRAIFLRIREPQTKSGSVTASSTSSGTVSGKKAGKGTVAGSAATSGTTVGKKNGRGTVTGSTASSGTVTGSKGGEVHSGSVTGTTTSSGTTVGRRGATGTTTGSTASSGTNQGAKAGTGTVTGSSTATGTGVGSKQTRGSVTGSSVSTGTEAGSKGSSGAATGSTTSSGTVTGSVADDNKSGTVTGTGTTTGTAVGGKNGSGTASGSVASLGATTGTAARTGTVDGSTGSTGTIGGGGSKPGPQPERGGGYLSYQPAPKPVIKRASGRVRGLSFLLRTRFPGARVSRGHVTGRCTISNRLVFGRFGYRAQRFASHHTITGSTRGHISEPRSPEYIEMDEMRRRLRDEMEIAFLIDHRARTWR